MVSPNRWVSSDVGDEWVYIIPLDDEEDTDCGYNIRRASLFGASFELETVKNCEAVKMSIAMRNFLVDDDDNPVEPEGFVKARNLSESQKRKLGGMASELGVEPYVVLIETPKSSPFTTAEASTLSEARSRASEIRNRNNTAGEVYDLVKDGFA